MKVQQDAPRLSVQKHIQSLFHEADQSPDGSLRLDDVLRYVVRVPLSSPSRVAQRILTAGCSPSIRSSHEPPRSSGCRWRRCRRSRRRGSGCERPWDGGWFCRPLTRSRTLTPAPGQGWGDAGADSRGGRGVSADLPPVRREQRRRAVRRRDNQRVLGDHGRVQGEGGNGCAGHYQHVRCSRCEPRCFAAPFAPSRIVLRLTNCFCAPDRVLEFHEFLELVAESDG